MCPQRKFTEISQYHYVEIKSKTHYTYIIGTRYANHERLYLVLRLTRILFWNETKF
jgi:hypothetical protein